jgi:hypothetical protein
LGWFATLEEGQAAYDAAAIMVHGPTATTNQSLGLLSPHVAATKPCRRAAKAARRVVKEYRLGELAKRPGGAQVGKDLRRQGSDIASIWAVGPYDDRPAGER